MLFFVVVEEFKKVVDELQRSVKSLQDQMTSLKSGEVPSGAKTPGECSSPVQQVGDKVPTWAKTMELETEALSSSGDEIRPVKVREETELIFEFEFEFKFNAGQAAQQGLFCPNNKIYHYKHISL